MDGLGGLDPIRAFCRKGRTPEDTITQINTTIQYDMNVINPTGKKIIPITYLADEESFRELFLHVRHCRQFVRYRCARSALFRSPGGPKAVSILKLETFRMEKFRKSNFEIKIFIQTYFALHQRYFKIRCNFYVD